jgi:hypothetical protein
MFSYECIPPNSQGRPMQGMIFVLPGNYHQLLWSPFHSQRSYKIKKTNSDLRFYQRQRHRKSECLTHHNFRLTFVLRVTQSPKWVTKLTRYWFPECMLRSCNRSKF